MWEAVAKGLGVPLSELLDPPPDTTLLTPEALQLAIDYQNLPPKYRAVVQGCVESLKQVIRDEGIGS
jgi:hypothetical protein